ncbi:exopolysaccharide biosynthesis polyprenyl glycosylphosphotransferase [Rhizomicrobium electricum]|uniref:exopolysaccharide biosynthesis polyprenyl glycosylphosphotransferase n=1 Tax=Rhizomicrobium electricum TaxID=480070 RepID=UPI0014237CB9|nr:exopolysaccharide biosynthesis polyprenyl glycosylphosphotransferase [Rhizomicrobium electricum]NIJ47904.1 Undecaprenyl-phosphate glucose phosphotransferase [Rhizomicrobium electricum]
MADIAFIVSLSVLTDIAYQMIAYSGKSVPFQMPVNIGLVIALAFTLLIRSVTAERSAAITNSYDRLRDAALAWTLAFGILTFGLFIAKAGGEASRGAIITLYLVGLPGIALWRVFAPVWVAPLAKRAGSAVRECMVIGDEADPLVDKFAVELRAKGHPSPKVFKFKALCSSSLWAHELSALADRVTQVAHHAGPGEIYVCAGSLPGERLAALGRRLTMLPRAIYIVPDAQIASLVRCRPASMGKFVVLEARREPLGSTQRLVKRMMDILVSGAALLFLFPLLMIVAALIKLDSEGPVLFRQTRNGYRGRPFDILKFRSMRVQENGPVIEQAKEGDARVTRVGRILRKYSIDELPQLVNILVGDMSLVGPRPHAQAHDELYSRSIENYEIRQHVKPGLTGWAQVNGLRGETATLDAMYQRIEYDLWYAVNASILLDIEILVRTAIEVARHRNAY